MRIVSISKIRNEADIVEAFVRYHAEIVDRMIILDHRSADNTGEILRELQSEGLPLDIGRDDSLLHLHSQAMTALMRQAAEKYDPDWLFPLDADEFLVALAGSCPREVVSLLPNDRVGLLPWRTYVPTAQDERSEGNVIRRIRHRRKDEGMQFYKVLIPKAFLYRKGLRITQGSHLLEEPSPEGGALACPSEIANSLYLAHFPVRSPEQLAVKAFCGWLSRAASPCRKPEESFHWKALFDRCRSGGLPIPPQELRELAAGYARREPPDGPAELLCDPIPVVEAAAVLRYPRQAPASPVAALAATAEELAAALRDCLSRAAANQSPSPPQDPVRRSP